MEYLIFVKHCGTDTNDNFIYQFDFSEDKDTAWGEDWNITPSALMPDLCPEVNVVSSSYRVIGFLDLETAAKNTCFSMQDCIDDIIDIAFTKITDRELSFKFGEIKEDVFEKLNNNGFQFSELQINDNADIIDNLINDLENEEDE